MNKYEITVPVESEHGPGRTLELFSAGLSDSAVPYKMIIGSLRLTGTPESDLPTVPACTIRNDALYELLTADDETAINHDTVREQAGEDA